MLITHTIVAHNSFVDLTWYKVDYTVTKRFLIGYLKAFIGKFLALFTTSFALPDRKDSVGEMKKMRILILHSFY